MSRIPSDAHPAGGTTSPRRVTHADIARRLNLHKSTVSLALRDDPRITAETRERVRAIAETLGYRPDPALATLARQRWAGHETGSGAVLAYVIDSRYPGLNLQRRFFSAARGRAGQHGFDLQEFDFADYADVRAAMRVLNTRGIRGILVPQLPWPDEPLIRNMPAEDFTVVCVGRGVIATPFHMVSRDMFQVTSIVWREVLRRGYRRIGAAIMRHSPPALDDPERLGASLALQHECLPAHQHIPVLTADPLDKAAFLAWMERHTPEAVIALVPRVHAWLCDAGWRVPEDVALAGLVAIPEECPHMSGCLRQEGELAAAGVDALIAAMAGHEWGIPEKPRRLLVSPSWYEGTSLPDRTVTAGSGS